MSILDNLQVHSTGARSPDDFDQRTPVSARLELKDTGASAPGVFCGMREKYFLKATVGVYFWASREKYLAVLDASKKVLLQHLYSGTLLELAKLEKAIHEGDKEAALAAAAKIRVEMGL